MFKSVLVLFAMLTLIVSDDNTISSEELIGKGNPDLYGEGFQLRKEAYDAFLAMQQKAREDGIEIEVVSSYRSFEHQKRIWTRKYNRFIAQGNTPEKAIEKIIEYSTIPGTSRHHWGTDIDIIDANVSRPADVLLEEHFNVGGIYHKLKIWLDNHASEFGFCLVYTNVEDRKGFKYEPWHFTYEPLSKSYLQRFMELDAKSIFIAEKIIGSPYFTDEFVEKYFAEHVSDINPDLL